MLVQAKLPEKIWSKVEEITPKYSYSKIHVDILDESITLTEHGYLIVPMHDEFGNLISENVEKNTTIHTVTLEDIHKEYLEDNCHFAVDYDNNIIPIRRNNYNKSGNYIKVAMAVCNRCMMYIFFPTSECTLSDVLIVIPTSENTTVTSNVDILSDNFKNIDLFKIKNDMYPRFKVSHPETIKAGEIAYFTIKAESTETSVDSSYTILIRAFSGIAVKTMVTCSDVIEAKVPVLTTGLEPGDKVILNISPVNSASDHNRFNHLYKISVV